MNSPLISVIVPCYNQAQYLDECLQSVLDQTYQHWECIIVNDGSPDKTDEVAKKWIEKDERFRYIHKENGGLSSARNKGIEIAGGEWILPLDADDKISEKYVELATNYFGDLNIKVIYSKAEKFGNDAGEWVLKPFTLYNLAIENIIFCTAFFRKRDWDRVGGYDEKIINGFEDWEFWISILQDGGEVVRLEVFCFYYRIKENSMLLNMISTKAYREEVFQYIEKKHIDFFHNYLGAFHEVYKVNKEQNEIINLVLRKRKGSRFVNQVYAFLEKILLKYKKNITK